MPFPESERILFEENTLVEVICQLRFPPILAIVSEPPAEFQNRVREVYPLYRREDPLAGLPVQVSNLLAELPVPKLDAVNHLFESEDGQRTVSLASEFLAVTFRDYERWEVMRDEIDRTRMALEEIYRPSFYSRLGLRYQDVVRKAELGLADRPWHELLNPDFTGLLGSEQVRNEVETVRADVLLRVGGDARVKITHGFVDESVGETYGIDMDFFTTERREGDDVRNALDGFNRQAGNLFRWAILPPLRDALRPRALEEG